MYFDRLKRRELITLLGGAAATWPLAARAQQPTIPVIGFLNSTAPDLYAPFVQAFRQGLAETGYVEGQNVAIEFRWAEGRLDRLPDLLNDLIRRQVAGISATSTPGALAARAANTTIPVVFTTANDPVRLGLVASLSRPGGNMTGATQLNMEVAPKRLEIFHELIPAATEFAHLVNPADPIVAEIGIRNSEAAARALGLKLHVLNAASEAEFEKVFATVTQRRLSGLGDRRGHLVHGLEPAARGPCRPVRRAGDLSRSRVRCRRSGSWATGGSTADSYRLAGAYAGRILKGGKPGDLPIQQSSKVEMIINLKSAKALGLTFPITLLGRADEVIE
jgi:putative ABC transport system substrate-binding protein